MHSQTMDTASECNAQSDIEAATLRRQIMDSCVDTSSEVCFEDFICKPVSNKQR